MGAMSAFALGKEYVDGTFRFPQDRGRGGMRGRGVVVAMFLPGLLWNATNHNHISSVDGDNGGTNTTPKASLNNSGDEVDLGDGTLRGKRSRIDLNSKTKQTHTMEMITNGIEVSGQQQATQKR
ncbi:hypothetical protein OROGR_029101 [Orobanche gracilis]